jgi:hypothetical protein
MGLLGEGEACLNEMAIEGESNGDFAVLHHDE